MRRWLFAVLYLGIGLAGLVAIVLWFQYARRTWITSQNAEVWAPTYALTAPVAGRVTAWTSQLPGSRMRAGQVLGTLQTVAGPVQLRAPHAGRLVGDFGYRGQLVQPGQEIALVADMGQGYVLAYVDESEASSLRVGQTADIYPASEPGTKRRGTVEKIYPAVASVTWPLPSIQTGAYSQQAQWVPVRLRIQGRGALYLGGTVTVGIWIGGGSRE